MWRQSKVARSGGKICSLHFEKIVKLLQFFFNNKFSRKQPKMYRRSIVVGSAFFHPTNFEKFVKLLCVNCVTIQNHKLNQTQSVKVSTKQPKVARSSGFAFFFFSFISSWSRHPIPFHEVFPLVETE